MKSDMRELRRRQIDRHLLPFGPLAGLTMPKGGWLRSVREALGLSLEQYAKRLGVASSSTAFQIERSEAMETITLRRLRSAADALGCDLVVAIVPRVPLEEMARRQALSVAAARMRRVGRTMEMEQQAVDDEELERMTQKTAAEILERGGPRLWG